MPPSSSTRLSLPHYFARLIPALLIAVLQGAALPGTATAGILPDAEAWERWRPASETRQIELDHSEWATLLDRYLQTETETGINLFDYKAVTASDRALLDRYIARLAGTAVDTLTRSQQQAFWINLYNALTVRLIPDNPGV
ncbi:MAG: hypothetical protein V2J89_13010, partial [Halieaceae bacterium]|nr:hypothetical protein [Halieaceae bacterium]